jgi:hypothetical protein
MSVGAGSYGDIAIRQYKDMIEQDVQQRGSLLRGVVDIEQVLGERTYFPKIGASTSYQITGRSQEVNVQDQVFERRFVTPTAIEAVHRIEKIDILRYARSPQPELVESLAFELGRQIDVQIINALSAAANRELNGVSSSITLANFNGTTMGGVSLGAGSQLILVNNNNFAGAAVPGSTALMSGNTSLHEGKIISAVQVMKSQGAILPGEQPIVIGNSKQFAALKSRVFMSNAAGYFDRQVKDELGGMFDRDLDGFLGARYIVYENCGNDNTGSYDAVYVITKRAIKLAMYADLDFRVDEMPQIQGTPVQVKAGLALGTVRMWDEAVIQLACNSTVTFS